MESQIEIEDFGLNIFHLFIINFMCLVHATIQCTFFLAMKRIVGSVVVLCAFLDRYINSAKSRKKIPFSFFSIDHSIPGVFVFSHNSLSIINLLICIKDFSPYLRMRVSLPANKRKAAYRLMNQTYKIGKKWMKNILARV